MGLGSEYLPAMPVYAAAVLACGAYYVLFGVLHELAHLGAARLLGCRGCLTWRNARDACCSRSVTVAGASGWRRGVIRHAAWVASVALAIAAGVVGECCRQPELQPAQRGIQRVEQRVRSRSEVDAGCFRCWVADHEHHNTNLEHSR